MSFYVSERRPMSKRDPLKGHLIGCIMAKHGCSFEMAECVYERYITPVLKQAVQLTVQMIIKKTLHDLTGQQTIGHNCWAQLMDETEKAKQTVLLFSHLTEWFEEHEIMPKNAYELMLAATILLNHAIKEVANQDGIGA